MAHGCSRLPARSPAPRPQPGPGPGIRPRALSRLGSIRPGATLAVNLDPTAERAFRSDKTLTPRAPEETLTSFSSALSLSSPHSALSSQRSRSQPPSERARATMVERKPWRHRRPPRRRALSPAGERAAVERPGRGASLASARRAAPWLDVLFPVRRSLRRRGSLFLFPFFDSCSLSCSD